MNKYTKKNKAFTLIEFMIAITIMAIMLLVVYVPYNYYSNKAKVKITSKEISQILFEARNLAIHWLDNWAWNLSVWVYFDSSEATKNEIRLFSYPYSYTWAQIIPSESDPNVSMFKTYKLQDWVEIDSVWWEENALFYFEAINGNGSYFYYKPNKNSFTDNIINISYSFKGSSNLNWEVEYITKTYVSDYK